MRAPASTLVLDAAILVAAALGRSTGVLLQVARVAVLVTTDRAVQETRRRIEFGLRRPELLRVVDRLVAELVVVPVSTLTPDLESGASALRDAVPSRNGSVRDAHLLALAWSVAGDVWTTDRDFAGTGVATWSTPNLLRALRTAER